jgi:hypothetical protein
VDRVIAACRNTEVWPIGPLGGVQTLPAKANCHSTTNAQLVMRALIVLLSLAIMTGCATRPKPLPEEHAWTLPWGAVDPDTGITVGLDGDIADAGRGRLPEDFDGDGRPDFAALIISGGGAKGAFGAGILKGWSASGRRPEFTIVTGVSTGALMATWAFLGPDYDQPLEHFYTHTTDDQVFTRKSLLLAPFSDSLLDTEPLRRTIAEAVDQRLLDEVAREYREGRRLYVASTDLDNRRLVVWDLGAIAASDRADRVERYREALRASASIPVGFSPVYFPIEIEGEAYGQMHVDGGAVANLFMTGFILDRQRKLLPAGIERGAVDIDFYVLVNSYLLPQPEGEPVAPSLISISTAAAWATSWSAQTDRLVRAYQGARGMGAGFHLVGIPDDYPGELPLASFDPATMTPLFRYAETMGSSGAFWLAEPPGIDWREHN